MSRIKPTQKIPNLGFATLSGSNWPKDKFDNPTLRLLVVYRGAQCSFCKKYVGELDAMIGQFYDRQVEVIALSADNRLRAEQAVNEWGLSNVEIGYDLDIDAAARLGLYISNQVKDSEMPVFTEPGVFLINNDDTLFAAWVQTYPFARPSFTDILSCIDYVQQHQRPSRGEA